MRIGYLFRGYLADLKLAPNGDEVSSPDGNASYSWCIEHECNARRHHLIPLGEELDHYAASTIGQNAFIAFSQRKRAQSYQRMQYRGWSKFSDRKFPELDLLLVEWRWPIPGRNTAADKGKPGYQRDLERQTDVLRHYGGRIPIVVWNLDHKLTRTDIDMWSAAGAGFRVIETSVEPTLGATRVHPPVVASELLQFPIDARRPKYLLGYIGSRYERDEVLDEWIRPLVPKRMIKPRVRFWGKWEPREECLARWPGIMFSERIGIGGFRAAYSEVAAVPLLGKRSYFECGFVTPRIAEAVMFGSVPVGLAPHKGIGEYVEKVVASPRELLEHARWIKGISPSRREILREEAAHRLSHTDVRHFVDVLEAIAR